MHCGQSQNGGGLDGVIGEEGIGDGMSTTVSLFPVDGGSGGCVSSLGVEGLLSVNKSIRGRESSV